MVGLGLFSVLVFVEELMLEISVSYSALPGYFHRQRSEYGNSMADWRRAAAPAPRASSVRVVPWLQHSLELWHFASSKKP